MNKKDIAPVIAGLAAGAIVLLNVWQTHEISKMRRYIHSHVEMVSEKTEPTVYITRTGTKYHRGSCQFLAKSKKPIALSEAKRKYNPCKVCNPP